MCKTQGSRHHNSQTRNTISNTKRLGAKWGQLRLMLFSQLPQEKARHPSLPHCYCYRMSHLSYNLLLIIPSFYQVSRSFTPLLTHFLMSSTSVNPWMERKTWLPCFSQLHPKLLILPTLLKSYPSWGSCYSIVPLLSFRGNVVYCLLVTSCRSLKTLACCSPSPSLPPQTKCKSRLILYLHSLLLYWSG